MSRMSSHRGPSHNLNIDHSHHEMSYGTYTNRGQQASGQGVITNINQQTTNYQYSPSTPLEELQQHCSHSAAVDSAARFDPPRCTESTRLGIVQIIEEWVNSEGDNTAVPSSLFWLHGGAGVGKSAIAQSLSEKFQEKKQLAASFFFFRGDATRNNGDHLIPTLVSHLVDTIEGIRPFVEDKIRKNRAIFTKRYQTQVRELLIEPLLSLKSKGVPVSHPRVIAIDGLDECQNPDVQCELLQVLTSVILQIPYPLLITSRPEAHITDVFNHAHDLQAITVHRYNLSDDPDADMDVRKFFEKEFVELRRVHRLRRHLPHAWPDRKAIASLVERSSGHFIYASTVIRYIRSPKHRPDDRLDVILRLRPPQEGDRPYAQLDRLFALIFEGVESHNQLEKICLVLGILHFQSKKVGYFAMTRAYTMEELLEMKPGDLVLLLDPILSLVAIDGDKVRILHKSLIDHLLDFTRGGHLPFNLSRVHESAATYILKRRIVRDSCGIYSFQLFAYHCQYAYLNDTLRNYLQSLEAPCPKSVIIIPKTFPRWDDGLNESLRSIVWNFFRTLSREDFDSTGELCEQYMAKWMDYLHSVVSRRTQRQSSAVAVNVGALKRVDALLKKWKPPNFSPMDGEMDSVRRVALIKQAHRFFLAYAQASFSGDTNSIASSLVFGDYFIHSYTWDGATFLVLQTYSRRNHACYQNAFVNVTPVSIVQVILGYLTVVEKYLFFEPYQQYGLRSE